MAAGGSFSAEHGVGQTRIKSLLRYKSAIEIDPTRSVKSVLDPRDVLNPGKVFPAGG